jgi:hypothetical protein
MSTQLLIELITTGEVGEQITRENTILKEIMAEILFKIKIMSIKKQEIRRISSNQIINPEIIQVRDIIEDIILCTTK